MSKQKSVRKSVSLIIKPNWLVDFYPVRWAHKQEEVPLWDPTRGFPLQIPSIDLWRESKLEAEEKYRNPSLDTLRELLNNDQWRPEPPPERLYPRLVRANITDPMFSKSIEPQEEDVIGPLNNLARIFPFPHPPGKKILSEVLALASKWGPAWSPEWDPVGELGQDGKGNNSLGAWMILALKCNAHLEAMGVLQVLDYEDLKAHLEDKDQQWVKDYENERFLYLFNRISVTSPWFPLKAIARNAKNAGEFRERIVDKLMSSIELYLHFRYRDGWFSHMYVREQMRWQLARAWMDEQPARVCEGCGRWFLSRRKNQRFCLGSKSSRCRVAKYSRERKAAQKAS